MKEPDTETDTDTDTDSDPNPDITVRMCNCTCEALICPCCPRCDNQNPGKIGSKSFQMKNPYPGRKALQDRCYLKKFKKFPIVEKIFQGVCPCSKCRPAYFEKQDKEAAGTDES